MKLEFNFNTHSIQNNNSIIILINYSNLFIITIPFLKYSSSKTYSDTF